MKAPERRTLGGSQFRRPGTVLPLLHEFRAGHLLKRLELLSRLSRHEETICHRSGCVGLRHQRKRSYEAASRFIGEIY